MHAKILAIKRRLALLVSGRFDPYPKAPDGSHLSPSAEHVAEYDRVPLQLAWSRAGIADPVMWQAAARARLVELLGCVRRAESPAVLDDRQCELPDGLARRQVYLRVAPRRDLPVNLVWDPRRSGARPVMICLHGHNAGAHLSWGETRMPADPLKIAAGADYARQAAARSYVALCLEQEGFGERREQELKHLSAHPCVDAAHRALLLGRTLLGERVDDVSSVIDWLEAGPAGIPLDRARIFAMGNSSGGDTGVYAMAVDTRITGLMASGCVGWYRDTVGRRPACPDAIVPGILNWLEYDDVLALCAPRPVLTLSGVRDHIYPFAQVAAVTEAAREVYRAMGAEQKLQTVSGPEGHRFYPEIAWPVFERMVG
jgi:dienelactone hydrolase